MQIPTPIDLRDKGILNTNEFPQGSLTLEGVRWKDTIVTPDDPSPTMRSDDGFTVWFEKPHHRSTDLNHETFMIHFAENDRLILDEFPPVVINPTQIFLPDWDCQLVGVILSQIGKITISRGDGDTVIFNLEVNGKNYQSCLKLDSEITPQCNLGHFLEFC